MVMMTYYIGVDVGTGSVRAGLFDSQGGLVTCATEQLKIWTPKAEYYEQSSDNIWDSVVLTVKKVLSDSGIEKEQVQGMGFDATCSLVIVDRNGSSVTASPSGNQECNVIMWMDHRAQNQTDRINTTKHPVLKYTGGQISIEMQPPKLLWLKENLSDTWQNAGHFFDLPDFLTWKATGSLSRSLCSLTCKWTYQADNTGQKHWCDEFWEIIGLQDFVTEKYCRCGVDVKSPGESCGNGLTKEVAEQLGLVVGTPVGASIIDAHAGVLGCIGCETGEIIMPDVTSRLTMICGTSTCHMLMNKSALFVPGVWGPYYSAILPELWVAEGGQTSAGKLIDFVVETHPAYVTLKVNANQKELHVHDFLYNRLEELSKENKCCLSKLTKNIHIWPDFHGNRSPLSDPSLRGMMCGLSLTSDLDSLAISYLATIQALAYGTRHIFNVLTQKGHTIELMYMCGGLSKNTLYVKTHVDVTGTPAILPYEQESVLLGAAILGASASENVASVQEAVNSMGGKGRLLKPDQGERQYHDKKYEVFLKMVEHQQEYTTIMNS